MFGAKIIDAPKVRVPIAGIREIAGPSATSGGIFALPPAFDRRKYAAQWNEEGAEADFAQQPEELKGLRLVADGWAVWKHPETGAPYRQVSTRAGKKYILMCRDVAVQQEINALYGDKSKSDIYKAQTGESIPTAAGQGIPSGMLTNADLKKVDGALEEETKAPVSTSSHPAGPLTQTTSTKETPK